MRFTAKHLPILALAAATCLSLAGCSQTNSEADPSEVFDITDSTETEGWLTYTSETAGFSFSIPSEWEDYVTVTTEEEDDSVYYVYLLIQTDYWDVGVVWYADATADWLYEAAIDAYEDDFDSITDLEESEKVLPDADYALYMVDDSDDEEAGEFYILASDEDVYEVFWEVFYADETYDEDVIACQEAAASFVILN